MEQQAHIRLQSNLHPNPNPRTTYGDTINARNPVRPYIMIVNYQVFMDLGDHTTGPWGGITVEPCGAVAPVPIFPPPDKGGSDAASAAFAKMFGKGADQAGSKGKTKSNKSEHKSQHST